MTALSSMEQQFLEKLTEVIDANLQNEDFGVSELASELGMSRVTLHRKVKSIIKKSVSEYIREARLKRAFELLQQKTGTISEIAYSVGFSSANYFTKCFHKYYGVTPGEVLKRNGLVKEIETTKKWPFSKKQMQFFVLAILLTLAVFTIYFFMPHYLFLNSDKGKTIVVLPFKIENTNRKYHPYINQIRDGIIQELKFMDNVEVKLYNNLKNYNDSLKRGKLSFKEKSKIDYSLQGTVRTLPEGTTTIFINLINSGTGKIVGELLRERELKLEGFDIKEMIDEAVISIKNELELYLSPDEEEKIEMNYTGNTEAYSMFEKGLYYFELFRFENDFDFLYRARDYFEKALVFDSTYVLPMEKLGRIIIINQPNESLTWEVFNRAMKYADNAIRIAPEYTPAYCLKATLVNMLPEKYGGGAQVSLNLLEKALKIDPNNWEIYHLLANNMGWRGKSNSDYAQLEYTIKAYKLNPDPKGDKYNLQQLSQLLSSYGYVDESKKVLQKIVHHYPDSLRYFNMMQLAEAGNSLNNSIKYGITALSINPKDLTTLDYLATSFLYSGDYKSALFYYAKYFDIISENNPELNNFHGRGTAFGYEARFPMAYYAYTFMENNKKEEANKLFKIIIDARTLTFETNKLRENDGLNFTNIVDLLELVQVYSAIGETKKALELFNFWMEKDLGGWINIWRDSPLIDNIKNEPKILEYCKKYESRENNVKRKVKKILKQEGFIEN